MHAVSPTKQALYFGLGSGGHFLWSLDGRAEERGKTLDPSFPWEVHFLDGGLLANRKVRDDPDGRVHVVFGGNPLWCGFFWWDRSGDKRGASNSGFYVLGFDHHHYREAFEYACAQWPDVVARQLYPLTLVPPPLPSPPQATPDKDKETDR